MDDAIKPVAEQFAFNSSLLAGAFAQVSEADATLRHGEGNSLLWLCGHIATARSHVLGLLGHNTKAPWDNLFEGTISSETRLPTIAAVGKRIEDSSRQLLTAIATVDRRTLMTAPPSPFPTVENTTLAAIAFLANHEAYHVGQVSYTRRLLGLPGLVELYMAAN